MGIKFQYKSEAEAVFCLMLRIFLCMKLELKKVRVKVAGGHCTV